MKWLFALTVTLLTACGVDYKESPACGNGKYYTKTLVNPSGTIDEDRPIADVNVYLDNSGSLVMVYSIQKCTPNDELLEFLDNFTP